MIKKLVIGNLEFTGVQVDFVSMSRSQQDMRREGAIGKSGGRWGCSWERPAPALQALTRCSFLWCSRGLLGSVPFQLICHLLAPSLKNVWVSIVLFISSFHLGWKIPFSLNIAFLTFSLNILPLYTEHLMYICWGQRYSLRWWHGTIVKFRKFNIDNDTNI